MTEEWRDIPGFADYQVSDLGRVRSSRHRLGNRWGYEYWRNMTPQVQLGYHFYALCTGSGARRRLPVNRLALMAFVGPAPTDAHQAAHLDNNPSNNILVNLCWKTPVENNQDKLIFNTLLVGSRHQNAKLTEAQVLQIRSSGASRRELAERFSVSQSLISQIALRRIWKHV